MASFTVLDRDVGEPIADWVQRNRDMLLWPSEELEATETEERIGELLDAERAITDAAVLAVQGELDDHEGRIAALEGP